MKRGTTASLGKRNECVLTARLNHDRGTTLTESVKQKWLTGPFENSLIRGKGCFLERRVCGWGGLFYSPFLFNKLARLRRKAKTRLKQFIVVEKYLLWAWAWNRKGNTISTKKTKKNKKPLNTKFSFTFELIKTADSCTVHKQPRCAVGPHLFLILRWWSFQKR